MIHALSPQGRMRLATLAAHGPALLAFDYDGTLAPVVAQPTQAAARASARVLLSRLGRHNHTAVISGRALADLGRRLGRDVAFLVGNHGAEGAAVPPDAEARCVAAVAAWRRALVDEGRLAGADRGAVFEDKRLSASLHYRHALDPAGALPKLHALAAALVPRPRVIGGKMVLNLLEADAADKARALQRLRDQLHVKSVLFVGDDDTDETAFALDLPNLVGVRVGYRANSAATLFVRGTGEVLALMRLLLRQPL